MKMVSSFQIASYFRSGSCSSCSYLFQGHLDGRFLNPIVSKVSRLGRLQMNLPLPRLPNLTMTMSLSLLYILFYTLSWNQLILSVKFLLVDFIFKRKNVAKKFCF